MNKRIKDATTSVQRAYSVVDFKSMDEDGDKVWLEGIATTPTPDRMGDIVEPDGAKFKLPIPLLWQHNASQPVGMVETAEITKDGISVRAWIKKGVTAQIDDVVKLLKAGLVRGLSIGFRGLDVEEIKGSWSLRFKEWEWLELSAVTIPANAEATIQAIKSIDSELRAASGNARPNPPPGVSGTKATASGRFFHVPNKGKKVQTYQEQIKDLEATKAAAIARMNEIQKAAEGRAKDEAEREEFKDLAAQIKGIEEELADLCELERLNQASARPVQAKSIDEGSNSRGPTIIVRKHDPDEKFAGQNFTRRVIAKALAFMDQRSPGDVAAERWGKTHPQLVEVIRAGVPAGSTIAGTDDWGSELVAADARYTGDFIEYLYGRTVFGQLPLRSVPENVTIKGQDGAATAYWTGEGKAIPVTSMDFMDVTLTSLEVDALAAITKKLVRESSPDAEMLVRDGLVEAARQRVDTTFLSTSAAVPGVSPAGILNGLMAGSPSGVDADALRADIATLYAGFISARNATGLYWVMGTSLAKQISLMRNALGQREFPDLTQNGGTLEGDPVVTGDNVTAGDFILMKPSDIYRIGDRGISVAISDQATIEMADDPTGDAIPPTAQSKQMVSMFQSNSIAVKVTLPINYAKRRSSAVAYIASADYGAAST